MENKYNIKKAKIQYEMLFGGKKTLTETLFFKNFGNLRKTESIDFANHKSEVITKNGYSYHINYSTNKCWKEKDLPQSDKALSLDFNDLSVFKNVGSETILDKDCQILEKDVKGSKFRYSIWERIPLKWEVLVPGITITNIAITIDENADFEDNIFEIPDNIIIKE